MAPSGGPSRGFLQCPDHPPPSGGKDNEKDLLIGSFSIFPHANAQVLESDGEGAPVGGGNWRIGPFCWNRGRSNPFERVE
jgi:hypothetical protein